ncbi:hypothetical protein D6D18_05201 [Aureobasidium pullulans]|nr:hypothetical protein D6D26_06294 [Aureobasidium pullulans]THW98276.1 hypothetical protein D6D18_05201 [Aureobasidium pullulans]THZ30486.1 hypothetical protein D6C89_01463 [Aureobasidium pullulans]
MSKLPSPLLPRFTELHNLAKARQGELRVAQHTRESLSQEYTAEVAQQKFENGKEIDRWMLLKDIHLHTHHQGRALVVRVFGEPVYLNNVVSLVNVVEDEAGDVEKVQLFFSSTLPPQAMLAKGTVIAVKEPYYELCDGSSYLRVDHPSNVKILRQEDPWFLEFFKTPSKPIPTAAACWKERGNHALCLKEYTDAIHCYTSGLNTSGLTEAYKRDLHRNRAAVNLLAGNYDAAKSDALESLTGHNDDESRKLDTKALYRAGRSSYHLREFLAAEELYQRLLAISPSDEDGLRELSKTQARLIEQDTGLYDFSSMAMQKKHVDCASFINRTEVCATKDRGRGLFATQDFACGDLVACEKAFAMAYRSSTAITDVTRLIDVDTQTEHWNLAGTLWSKTIRKIFANPSLAPKVLDMHTGSFHRTKTPLQMVDDTPVVDVFLVNSIIECAAFGAIESNAREPFGNNPNVSVLEYPTQNPVGLWINASYVNHSCIPNVAHSYIGDMMILRAAKNIPKGTEITMAYRKPHADPEIRQAEYQKLFGFRCTCNLCTAEAQRSAFHKLLVTQAAEQPLTWLLSNIEGMARFAEAQALVITTIHAYSTATLKSLPRWSLPEAHACMMFNYRSAKDLDKTEECAIALANDLGYQITIERTRVHLDRTNGYSDMIMVDVLANLTEVAVRRGHLELALEFQSLAKEMYIITNGVISGMYKKYGKFE